MQKIQIKHPDKKISAQFADFTAPMLESLQEPKKPDEVEKVFKIGYMVSNAVVLSDARGDSSLLDQIQRLTSHVVETELITKNLIDRKRKYFGNDERLIGDYKISINNGMLHIRAEAKSPYSPHISTS